MRPGRISECEILLLNIIILSKRPSSATPPAANMQKLSLVDSFLVISLCSHSAICSHSWHTCSSNWVSLSRLRSGTTHCGFRCWGLPKYVSSALDDVQQYLPQLLFSRTRRERRRVKWSKTRERLWFFYRGPHVLNKSVCPQAGH